MSKSQVNFRQTDMTRALRAAKLAGCVVGAVRVDAKTGDFKLEFLNDMRDATNDDPTQILDTASDGG